MGSKFFDIQFRSHSSDSDFACRDGEVNGDEVNGDKGYGDGGYRDEGYGINGDKGYGGIGIDIQFGLVRDTLRGWHANPDQFPMKTLVATEGSMEYWTRLGAQLLARFKNEAGLQGLFVAPFYVMAAWKMADGGYMSPTEPVLMMPNSVVPLVATDGDVTATELEFKIAAAVCSLYFRMAAPEALRDWVGKIESLEIFVSEPLIDYDTFSAFLPSRHVTTDNHCESLDPVSGVISRQRVCTETLQLAWSANQKGSWSVDKGRKFYAIASVPLSEVDLAEEWTGAGIRDGIYGDKGSGMTFEEISGRRGSSVPIVIEGKDEETEVETRPLKLSGAGELKRISRVYLRGNYDPAAITMRVYGSRDMLTWWKIAERRGGSAVALPYASFRFFRVAVSGMLRRGETLEGIVCGVINNKY